MSFEGDVDLDACVVGDEFVCPFCSKHLSNKHGLIRHIRTHTGDKPYTCVICSKSFADRQYLVLHTRMHTGERPYACETCDKRFSSQSNLIQHSKVHRGVRPHECQQCHRRFTQLSGLKCHLRTHTGERPFVCNICGRSFAQLTNMKKHQASHMEEVKENGLDGTTDFQDPVDGVAEDEMEEEPSFREDIDQREDINRDVIENGHESVVSLENSVVSDVDNISKQIEAESEICGAESNCIESGETIQHSASQGEVCEVKVGKRHKTKHSSNIMAVANVLGSNVYDAIASVMPESDEEFDYNDDDDDDDDYDKMDDYIIDTTASECKLEEKSSVTAMSESNGFNTRHDGDVVVKSSDSNSSVNQQYSVQSEYSHESAKDLDNNSMHDSMSCTDLTTKNLSLSVLPNNDVKDEDNSNHSKFTANPSNVSANFSDDNKEPDIIDQPRSAAIDLSSKGAEERLENTSEVSRNDGVSDSSVIHSASTPSIRSSHVVPANYSRSSVDTSFANNSTDVESPLPLNSVVKRLVGPGNLEERARNSSIGGHNRDASYSRMVRLGGTNNHGAFAGHSSPDMSVRRRGRPPRLQIPLWGEVVASPSNDSSAEPLSQKPFRCKTCSKHFSTLGNLKQHLNIHSGVKPYVCSVCPRSFSSKGGLLQHTAIHTNARPYVCNICFKGFNQSGNLRTHQRTHTGEKPYRCPVCGKGFGNIGNMRNHARLHGYVFPSKDSDNNSPNKDTDGGSEMEDEAEDESSSQAGLDDSHESVDSESENSQASSSPSKNSSNDKPRLQRRLNDSFSSHTQPQMLGGGSNNEMVYTLTPDGQYTLLSTPDVPVMRPQRRFLCSVCMKEFAAMSSLEIHMTTHTGEKRYECNICGRRFAQTGTLKVHMRTHTGEKPYSCTVCDKRFSQSGSLDVHMKTHQADRYPCEKCGEKFSRMMALRQHDLTVHCDYLNDESAKT